MKKYAIRLAVVISVLVAGQAMAQSFGHDM